ncbi:unnamed protein product [Auanema sp. JU1783]|nr:unnamed protein product [Auanema sp. JU1783]
MHGALRLLTKRFPVFQLKALHNGSSSIHKIVTPSTNNLIVPTYVPKNDISEIGPLKNFRLPALDNPRDIYTFPTLNPTKIVEPFISTIIEKADPTKNISIECPSSEVKPELSLAPRLLTIRRKKMKKHKRRKRYDRDFFKYQKYHREKKLKAEREFLKRMKSHLAELDAFNPEKYVRETITEAKKEWSDELAPTGRKLYPHWSRLMTLEELYGLQKDDYIDKKAGFPTDEDLEKIKSLKLDYANKYRKV